MQTEIEPVDIVLMTHNNLGMTIWCIEHIYRNTAPKFRLVVVDDSTDLTLLWIKEWQKTHDNLIFMHSDKPYTCGNQIVNIGIRSTESPFVAWLVNSCMVQPDWLNLAIPFMAKNTEVGLMGFKMLKPSMVIEHAGIAFTPDMMYHRNYGVGDPAHYHTYIQDMGIVGWSAILLNRKAFPKDGFDEVTYKGWMGFDDLDNCLTIQNNGWKVVYNGFGVGIHYATATKQNDPKGDEYWEYNRKAFRKKWFKDTDDAQVKQKEDYISHMLKFKGET